MGNSAEPYEVKLLNRLLDFDENLCELLFFRNMTLFFIKFSESGTLWIFYFISVTFSNRTQALGRRQSESERATLRDAERLRKKVTIQSILVQSGPSWALNDHKD